MALKWTGILVAVVAVTLAATANVLTNNGNQVPGAINLFAVAAAVTGALVAVLADLYTRLNTRLAELRELVVARFDRLDAETGDRNAGFVEGYLAGHAPEAAVVPMTPRGRRAAGGADDSY